MSDIIHLGVRLTKGEIRDFRVRFRLLGEKERQIAILIADGANSKDAAAVLDITRWDFYRGREVVMSVLRCPSKKLPRAVFAALGLLTEHSM